MSKPYRLGLLPNGCSLYMKENEVGGRTYYSDEIPGGVEIWDTALIDTSTLLSAIVEEERINKFFSKNKPYMKKDKELTYDIYLKFKRSEG